MKTAGRGMLPGFDQAATRAVAVLDSTFAQLERMSARAETLRARNDLSYLSSLAQHAGQRGLHLIDEIPDRASEVATGELADLLATTQDQLIENSSALDDFLALEFVSDVGALSRGVRRYVEHN